MLAVENIYKFVELNYDSPKFYSPKILLHGQRQVTIDPCTLSVKRIIKAEKIASISMVCAHWEALSSVPIFLQHMR